MRLGSAGSEEAREGLPALTSKLLARRLWAAQFVGVLLRLGRRAQIQKLATTRDVPKRDSQPRCRPTSVEERLR